MKKIIFVCSLVFLCGCTDALKSKFSALGGNQSIKCYSGGHLIFEGESSGKVINEAHSDGYYFREKATGKLVEVTADCVFKQE